VLSCCCCGVSLDFFGYIYMITHNPPATNLKYMFHGLAQLVRFLVEKLIYPNSNLRLGMCVMCL
jgi:hypothetical protein